MKINDRAWHPTRMYIVFLAGHLSFASGHVFSTERMWSFFSPHCNYLQIAINFTWKKKISSKFLVHALLDSLQVSKQGKSNHFTIPPFSYLPSCGWNFNFFFPLKYKPTRNYHFNNNNPNPSRSKLYQVLIPRIEPGENPIPPKWIKYISNHKH